MIDGAKSKNATPIISSHTPMDPYRIPGFFLNDLTPWVGFAAAIAEASDVPYVDHFGVSRLLSQSVTLLTNS